MFLVNALQVLCGRTVIEVFSRPRSLKFVYVSRGSRDLARQALLFLSCFLLSFFVPPIFLFCDKEQKKERLRRRLIVKAHTANIHVWYIYGVACNIYNVV